MGTVFGVELMRQSSRRRRLFVVIAGVGATLLAASAPAHAQLPGGPGAVDQYVEDVPTGGGSSHPTNTVPEKYPVSGSVAQQIAAGGGSDAPLLTEVVSSSSYGAPKPKANAKGNGGAAERMERGDAIAEAAPNGAEASGVVSSAITAVEDADSRRLFGLLLALLSVSVATVVAVGLRQRRADSG